MQNNPMPMKKQRMASGAQKASSMKKGAKKSMMKKAAKK